MTKHALTIEPMTTPTPYRKFIHAEGWETSHEEAAHG